MADTIIQLAIKDNTISLKKSGNTVELLQVGRRGLQGIPGETGGVDVVNGKTGVVTLIKSDIGLSNIDNTSDLNKPVSTATTTALALRAALTGATFTGTVTAPSFVSNSTGRPAFLKTTSTVEHVLTAYLANPTGTTLPFAGGLNNTAGNFVSENYNNSTVFVSGAEKNRGTLKVAHKGFSDGSDASAAALSIDLQTQYNGSGEAITGTGTQAQGIFITSTTDISSTGFAGAPITVRTTTGNDDFIVKGNGYLQLGAAIGSTAQARLDVRQPSTGQAIFIQQAVANTGDILIAKDSTGVARLRIDQNLNLVASKTVYAVIGAQIGGTSTTFGNGSGILGITNANTVPTAAPTGGIAVYSEGGILKYRSSSNTIYTLDATGTNTGDQDLSPYATNVALAANQTADRARANHTGTQLATTISDFDTAVSANTTVTGKVSKAGDSMTGALSIANSSTATGLLLTQTGITSASVSAGGAVRLDNTGNTGAGLIIYSNAGASTGRLMNIKANNALFNQAAFHVDYAGIGNAVEISSTSTDTSSQALNIVSTNPNDTTLGINGQELNKGTVKIVHTGTGTDTTASALSIDLAGTGTASQGIFLDATGGGTTGDLLKIRNNGLNRLVLTSDGNMTLSGTATASNLSGTNTGDQDLSTYSTKTYTDAQTWNPQETPADHNLKTWSYDPVLAVNNSTFTAGTAYVVKVKIPAATTITTMNYTVGTAGNTVANAYMALYQGGTLLAQSADISSTLTSTGNKTATIASTAVAAGYIQIVFWVGSATTVPALARGASSAGMNIGLTGTNLRYSTANTGLTTTAPATLGAQTTLNLAFWVGAN